MFRTTSDTQGTVQK